MIAYPWGALYVGIMLCLAGIFTLIRHYLLEPEAVHYPRAPLYVRNVMFAFATLLMFTGLQFLWIYSTDSPNTAPPQPLPQFQLLVTGLVIYKATLLVNIVRQRYTEEVWIRLERINEFLRCRQGTSIKDWLARSR